MTATCSTAGVAGASSTGAELGLTVMIGVPVVTADVTENEPAKTDCTATGPDSPARTSTASVRTPDSELHAEAAGDLRAVVAGGDQDRGGAGRGGDLRERLGLRGDQEVVQLGAVDQVDLLGAVAGERLDGGLAAGAQDHGGRRADAAGQGEQLKGGLADVAVGVLDENKDLGHVRGLLARGLR